MLLYGSTMFLSAFLLFVVQPLLGKIILPWFGGAPAVWTGCMLFFQVLLLAGYAYAHLLAGRSSPKRQGAAHILLLVASLAVVSGLLSGGSKSPAGGWSLPRSPGLLAVLVGVPYFLLASTSPLLQSWFSRKRAGFSPYRLYSISNAGSLLAILAYPVLIEPAMPLRSQVRMWVWGYAVFALACAWCARQSNCRGDRQVARAIEDREPAAAGELTAGDLAAGDLTVAPTIMKYAMWLLLPACSSLMLLATTNQLCLDVAAIPLLWVLPLGLYLLSFILCFHSPRWYSRLFVGILFAGALGWTCKVLFDDVFSDIRIQIASSSLTLFAACMICHGELARLKPGAKRLTAFYGAIAAGGALGGVFTTFVAPAIFKGYWEYHLGLLFSSLLFLLAIERDRSCPLHRGRLRAVLILMAVGAIGLALILGRHVYQSTAGNIEASRNFFGVLRIIEDDRGDPRYHRLTLMHGRIQHGFQYRSSFRSNWPTTYYSAASGVGMALRYHPARVKDPSHPRNMRIGVVGLGTGTLASYGLAGDYFRFYEINPEVVRLARMYFTFLDSPARTEIVAGDARIAMERERDRGELQRFDVLAVDAFSGDAIPVHLLTRECLEIYRAHLKPDGILALHISSRYFNLAPIARGLADLHAREGTRAALISCPSNRSEGISASDWVLITSNSEFLGTEEIQQAIKPWGTEDPAPMLWTDGYSNLFHLLRHKS